MIRYISRIFVQIPGQLRTDVDLRRILHRVKVLQNVLLDGSRYHSFHNFETPQHSHWLFANAVFQLQAEPGSKNVTLPTSLWVQHGIEHAALVAEWNEV